MHMHTTTYLALLGGDNSPLAGGCALGNQSNASLVNLYYVLCMFEYRCTKTIMIMVLGIKPTFLYVIILSLFTCDNDFGPCWFAHVCLLRPWASMPK